MKNQVDTGILRIVGTPIGNLGDMSERARQALAEAEVIACEDTRRSGQLLRLLGIKAPKMISFYKENEGFKTAGVVDLVKQGKNVALVSDGGMPGVSDPGAVLVAAARKAGLRVEVIPGPSAVVTAVAGCGFDGGFVFIGFAERKAKALKAQLQALVHETRMLVFYESPQRVHATVEIMAEVFGTEREAWLARELTKMHEEWIGPDLGGIASQIDGRDIKGECVLVVKGGDGVVESASVDDAEIVKKLKAGGSVKDVAAWVVEIEGVSKKDAYARVQELKG